MNKMKINIEFYGYFKKYRPSNKKVLSYEPAEPITIEELCNKINTEILKKSPGFLINGLMATRDSILKDGDKLSIITHLDGG